MVSSILGWRRTSHLVDEQRVVALCVLRPGCGCRRVPLAGVEGLLRQHLVFRRCLIGINHALLMLLKLACRFGAGLLDLGSALLLELSSLGVRVAMMSASVLVCAVSRAADRFRTNVRDRR